MAQCRWKLRCSASLCRRNGGSFAVQTITIVDIDVYSQLSEAVALPSDGARRENEMAGQALAEFRWVNLAKIFAVIDGVTGFEKGLLALSLSILNLYKESFMLKLISRACMAVLLVFSTGLAWAEIEINTATATELAGLKGIGPSTAERIIEERAKEPFANWQSFIARTPGVGDKKAHRLSEAGLTVNGQALSAPPVESTAPQAAAKR